MQNKIKGLVHQMEVINPDKKIINIQRKSSESNLQVAVRGVNKPLGNFEVITELKLQQESKRQGAFITALTTYDDQQ